MLCKFNIDISMRYTEIGIPMSESKFPCRIQNSSAKPKFRCQNRNSDSNIKIRMEIPMSKLKPKFRNRLKICWNFDFVESKRSKLKSKFPFWHRNWNYGKSKHSNFDQIKIKFCQTLDFVVSKKNDFRETLTVLYCSFVAWWSSWSWSDPSKCLDSDTS
jgi:hypothetical protein